MARPDASCAHATHQDAPGTHLGRTHNTLTIWFREPHSFALRVYSVAYYYYVKKVKMTAIMIEA